MKNLAVFYGGKSVEHDISIITALQVIDAIDKKQFNVIPVYIDKNNNWQILKDYKNLHNYAINKYKSYKLATGLFNKYLLKSNKIFLTKYKRIDVAINCCHGINGEDGTLSGVFELGNIAYVGSGVLASAVGMDKVIMKNVFECNNLPITNYLYSTKEEYLLTKNNFLQNAELKLNYPIIVKPANLGSSIGISIAKDRESLINAIDIAFEYDDKIILENVVQNLREINCSCIKSEKGIEISYLEEPINWKNFLDFDEKYINSKKGCNNKILNVKLNSKIENLIKQYSKKAFKLLGCKGVARIDFLLDDKNEQLFINEINTIPGSFSYYLWKDKYTFQELISTLIKSAEREYIYKNMHKYTYNSNVLNNYEKSNKITQKLKF